MTLQDLVDYRDAGVVERDPRGLRLPWLQHQRHAFALLGRLHQRADTALPGTLPLGATKRRRLRRGLALDTVHVMAESMRLAFEQPRSLWMGDADAVTDLPDRLACWPMATSIERCEQIQVDARLGTHRGDPEPGDPRPGSIDDFASAGETMRPWAPVRRARSRTRYHALLRSSTVTATWSVLHLDHRRAPGVAGIIGAGLRIPAQQRADGLQLRPVCQNDDPAPTFNPGANDVAPGKRPRSSMSPTLVFEDDTSAPPTGSPGGSTIINSVVNMTVNLIDHGLSVSEAIDAPRISVTGKATPSATRCVTATCRWTTRPCARSANNVADEPEQEIGSIQAVAVDSTDGLQYGGADSRRVGTVIGLPVAQ